MDAVSLGTPHVAGSPETADDLVGHHQDVILLKHCLDFFKVGGRGYHDPTSAHDGFRHERRDGVGVFLKNQLLKVVGQTGCKCFFRFSNFAISVVSRRIGVDHPFKRQVKIILHQGDCGKAAPGHGYTVVAPFTGDNLLFLWQTASVVVVPGKADHRVDRL